MRKTLVISAISLRSGGTLSILKDCLRELSDEKYAHLSIHALVKDRSLIPLTNTHINFIALDGTGSYLKRLFYEYYYFKRVSRKLKPDVWLSLHDITPNVTAGLRAVYCHNPAPFYTPTWRNIVIDPLFFFFNTLYGHLYRINIHKNDYVIVQQDWLRHEFSRLFSLPEKKIIVAHPRVSYPIISTEKRQSKTIFIYPALPRFFKNMELIGEAIMLLQKKGIKDFEVILTITGKENRYARWIKKNYGHLTNLCFHGEQPREKIFELYAQASCLLFPSRLETWGLPISEFKQTGKPILLSDLPYAHETLGDYPMAAFFNPVSPEDLAARMESVILGEQVGSPAHAAKIEQPMTENWEQLFGILLWPKTDAG